MTRILVTGFEPFGGAGVNPSHVPLLPEQALDRNVPSMPLETVVQAARIVVRSTLSGQ